MPTTAEWCAARGIALEHYATVKFLAGRLTEDELAAQVLAAHAGFDPRPVQGFSKLETLFNQSGPAVWREDEKEIFLAVAAERHAAHNRSEESHHGPAR